MPRKEFNTAQLVLHWVLHLTGRYQSPVDAGTACGGGGSELLTGGGLGATLGGLTAGVLVVTDPGVETFLSPETSQAHSEFYMPRIATDTTLYHVILIPEVQVLPKGASLILQDMH